MQPAPFGFYDPPPARRGRPAVITWFRVYSAAMAVLVTGFLVGWLMLALSPPAASHDESWILAGFGAALAAAAAIFAVGAFVPYKPWAWTFGLVLICLGLSGGTVVFSVPLLVFWLKPETKAAFGRL